jgi:DNA adenine methylase
MKPFLKWAGGKYRIIDKIRAALPPGNRLIEPFAGSGSVFLNMDYPDNLIADANADLINLFQHVQSGGKEFIEYCQQFFVSGNNQPDAFYHLREEMNTTSDLQLKAALFIYLNRHCFNGLCRYNGKGEFNVPFGRYTKPMLPEPELLNFWSKSQAAKFEVADFANTMNRAEPGDVVYCDPPYVPLTATANFSDYTKEKFGLHEQRKLADLAGELMHQGVSVVISNHDTEFTRSVYSAAKIDAFDVQRFISRDADNRNKVGELLAIFTASKCPSPHPI